MVAIMKVFKQNNKFTVYLSTEAVQELGIREDDEVDFFRYSEKAFLFMKKADVANMLMGSSVAPKPVIQNGSDYIGNDEIAVLKKLDTVRYPQRTAEKVAEMLGQSEKAILQQLIKKGAVSVFRKNNTEIYSISKSIYDRFLMRKKQEAEVRQRPVRVQLSGHIEGPYSQFIKSLEENGFLVVQTEAEAGGVSLALEQSIRQGKVLGTRSFNKKFYIVTRQFFDEHNPAVVKAMRSGTSKVGEIAAEAGMSEDAARSVLYLLAEYGDVRERRKDSFALA